MVLGFIISKRGIEAIPKKIATIAQHPEPLLGAPEGYTHPRERPLVIAKVLEPGTYKLAGGQGEVFIISKRGIEAIPKKIATIAQHPEPLLGAPEGYTHPRERPLVIAKVLEPGTYKLAGGQGEVYGNAWNVRQLCCF